MDKLRVGIGKSGMSPNSDLLTGGADYIFTRVTRATERVRDGHITFTPKMGARVDAISYGGDKFGETSTEDFILRHRRGDLYGMRKNADYSSNETIFKGGFSLFDTVRHFHANSESEKASLINVFRAHGLKKWPDGRSLEEIVKVASR